jgi:hypothetical protein
MYRRPEAWLGWCVLGLSHPFVQCLGMMVLLLTFSSSTDNSVRQFALAVNRSAKSLSVKVLSPWKLMLRDGLNLYAVSLSPD